MAHFAKDISWLIGRTPLVEVRPPADKALSQVLAKLESFNPSSSNKDRAVRQMVEEAESAGQLQPGSTIVECTSGDTGIALAMMAASRGYRLILTMPQSMVTSRCNLIRAMGAEIIQTPTAAGIAGAMAKAEALAKEIAGAVVLQPFINQANVRAHQYSTAVEIWEDTAGEVDMVVCPVATGGVAAGCARFFAPRQVPVYGVEPAASAVLSGQAPGPHNIPGLGAGFIPDILNVKDLHGVVQVTEAQAFAACRSLAKDHGILAGPASGAVLHAAEQLAQENDQAGKMIVAVLPDSGERYEDHAVFAEPQS